MNLKKEMEVINFMRGCSFKRTDAIEILDIMDDLNKQEGILNNDYVVEWIMHWYRFSSWEELVQSEWECGSFDTDNKAEQLQECEDHMIQRLGTRVFRLTSGMYIECLR